MNTFNVAIASNDGLEVFPDNFNANFRVPLPHPINLTGNWQVAISRCHLGGLIDISPYLTGESVISIKIPQEYVTNVPGLDRVYAVKLDPNLPLYTAQDVINNVNAVIPTAPDINGARYSSNDWPARLSGRKLVTLTLDSEMIIWRGDRSLEIPGQATAQSILPLGIAFSDSLSQLLGITSRKPILLHTDQKVQLGNPSVGPLIPQAAFIYSNFTKPIIIGDKHSRVLKVVPLSKAPEGSNPGQMSTYESTQMNYIEVDTANLNVLEIRICDVAGNHIQFHRDAKSSLNLIFREIY
jgi:hypothetical protein